MNTENIRSKEQPAALKDFELDMVAGGSTKVHNETTGKYYRYYGSMDAYGTYSTAGTFCCPNCNRVVHKGSWGRWYCDPCNESWYFTGKLIPNMESGLWEEISRDEFYSYGT